MKKLLLFLTILLASQQAFCKGEKNDSKKDPLLEVTRLDSLSSIIQYYLEETTSKHFEDPRVPRFLLKSRDDNFVFGVGGSVEAKLYYDQTGSKDNSFKMSKSDAISEYDNDVLDLNLNSTSLTFKVLGKTKVGIIDAFIAVDFKGPGNSLALQQAYIDVFGLRIGKTNTGFRDDESISMIDGNAILSRQGRKIPQVSYSYRFKNGLRTQIGAEFTQATSVWVKDTQNKNYISPCTVLLPDLTANVYYTKDRIHLYGGLNGRMMNYYDEGQKYSGIPAYAVQGSMNWAFVKREEQTHKLFAQAIWTHGMADCSSSLTSQGLSAIINWNTEGYKIIVPNMLGGYVGYQAKFGDNTIDFTVSSNKVFGQRDAGIGEVWDWAYAGGLNYFRTIFKNGNVGAEAIFGRRFDVDGASYTNTRLYVYIRYNF